MSSVLSYFMNALRLLSHRMNGHDLLYGSKISLLYFVSELKIFFMKNITLVWLRLKINLIKYWFIARYLLYGLRYVQK